MIVSPAAISIPEATSPVASMLRQMHPARTYWPAALYRSKFALALTSPTIMERPTPWPRFMVTEGLAPWRVASQIRNA